VHIENPMYMKPYYPWWRLDKNILWGNLDKYITTLLYGIFTLKIFKIKNWHWFKPPQLWMPPLDGRKWIQ